MPWTEFDCFCFRGAESIQRHVLHKEEWVKPPDADIASNAEGSEQEKMSSSVSSFFLGFLANEPLARGAGRWTWPIVSSSLLFILFGAMIFLVLKNSLASALCLSVCLSPSVVCVLCVCPVVPLFVAPAALRPRQNPLIQTQSSLREQHRHFNDADPSFDLDGDGVVSAVDFRVASMFDKDRDGRLNVEEKQAALQALKQGTLDRFYLQVCVLNCASPLRRSVGRAAFLFVFFVSVGRMGVNVRNVCLYCTCVCLCGLWVPACVFVLYVSTCVCVCFHSCVRVFVHMFAPLFVFFNCLFDTCDSVG